MSEMRDRLKDHIKSVLEGLRHLDVDSAADLIAEVSDEIAEDGPEDLFNGAILDGIRWGHNAAVTVELGGGTMLRVILPGGVAMTHEWADGNAADPQIKAVFRSLNDARMFAADGDQADLAEVNRVLSNAIDAACRSFGAPGDWGYGTREGDAVLALHQARVLAGKAVRHG